MREEKGYLKFLINEPIYLVKEAVDSSTAEVATPSEQATEQKVELPTMNKPDGEVAEPAASALEPKVQEIAIQTSSEEKEKTAPTKKLLVIYQFEESEPLPVHLKKLMLKIIEAVGIDVMKGVYVNQSFKEIPSSLTDFENILIFSPSTDLPLDGYKMKALYETQQFGKTRVLVSDELQQLDQQVPLKRKLWGVLQEMFPK
ncbi:MAG: hypothetical protein RIC80_18330 [Cyclobacteriaceae bacterium]